MTERMRDKDKNTKSRGKKKAANTGQKWAAKTNTIVDSSIT